jgi:hypothetical protein
LPTRGVKTVGEIPQGLPAIGLPGGVTPGDRVLLGSTIADVVGDCR